MREESNKFEIVQKISSAFEASLDRRNEENNKRHAKTDSKIDKLIDTMQENTIELREARKDTEHLNKRTERVELTQKEQGKEVRLMSQQLILMEDRQKEAKESKNKVIAWFFSVAGTISALAIALAWGLK